MRRKCPYYGASCFVHGSRRRAAAADIVVTNHSLLFCDLAADGGLLPPIRYWVVDEAHGAEQEARKAFSSKLSSEELVNIAHKVASDDSRNIFARVQCRAAATKDESQENLLYALTGKAFSAGKEFNEAVKEYVPQVKELLMIARDGIVDAGETELFEDILDDLEDVVTAALAVKFAERS